MATRLARLAALLLSLLQGCTDDKTSFSGTSAAGSADAPGAIEKNSDESKAPGFHIATIPPLAVNAGRQSALHSETLREPIPVANAQGEVTFTVSSDTIDPSTLKVEDGNLVWKPGRIVDGDYESEAGPHSVEISAQDASGNSATQTANITVNEVYWNIFDVPTSTGSSEMHSKIEIHEASHRKRVYAHVPTIEGKALGSKTCRSLDGSKTIELEEAPKVVAVDKKTGPGLSFLHTHQLTMKFSPEQQSKQGIEKIGLITWLNFVPDSPDAPPIRFYFTQIRCLDGSDQATCREDAVSYQGMSNYFLCSDYKRLEGKALYCSAAALTGITPDGC